MTTGKRYSRATLNRKTCQNATIHVQYFYLSFQTNVQNDLNIAWSAARFVENVCTPIRTRCDFQFLSYKRDPDGQTDMST